MLIDAAGQALVESDRREAASSDGRPGLSDRGNVHHHPRLAYSHENDGWFGAPRAFATGAHAAHIASI